jgi:hypothetical protein
MPEGGGRGQIFPKLCPKFFRKPGAAEGWGVQGSHSYGCVIFRTLL